MVCGLRQDVSGATSTPVSREFFVTVFSIFVGGVRIESGTLC
jgi:hypothetical protein